MTADVKQCTFILNELKGEMERAKEINSKLNARVNSVHLTLDMAQDVHDKLAQADDELRALLCSETNGPPTGAH